MTVVARHILLLHVGGVGAADAAVGFVVGGVAAAAVCIAGAAAVDIAAVVAMVGVTDAGTVGLTADGAADQCVSGAEDLPLAKELGGALPVTVVAVAGHIVLGGAGAGVAAVFFVGDAAAAAVCIV